MNREEKSLLIISYLDNTITDEGCKILEDLLVDDAETAALLYDLSVQHILLHRIGKAAAGEKQYKQGQWKKASAVLLSSAAVLLLTAGVLFHFLPMGYPAPEAAGAYVIKQGDRFERNRTLTAKTETMIHLGGYCSIACTPGTVCTLRGEPYKEALFLVKGTLTCSVDSDEGEFSVLSDMGNISVLGTEFSVTVKKKGEDQESGAGSVCMEVSVTSGSVAVKTGAGERVIEAGEVAAFAGPDAERGPESIETVQQTECNGPMLMYGGDLYAVSGSVLCRIDAVSGEMTAKKDLSSLGSEQASLCAERGDAARLFVNREKLFMLKNGMLFVFDVKTLTLERTFEIADPVTTNRDIQRSGSVEEQDLF